MRPFLALFVVSRVAIVTLFCAAMAGVQGIDAGTLMVTTTADSGAGSLRDTIAAAGDGDTIQFDAALNGQSITLTSAQLTIDKPLTIDGPGASHLTVQRSSDNGTPAFRIFEILHNHGDVTLAGLTITNGNAPTGGGGIFHRGTGLMVSNCVISGNSASDYGGGILCSTPGSASTTATIINSTISGNSSPDGGGIFNIGFLTISGSTISSNSASRGGGISNHGGLALTNSTISANVATGDEIRGGGGIFSNGSVTIINSTISGNSASQGGGIKDTPDSIFAPGGLTITNSTISGNSAGAGGGIYAVGNESTAPRTFRNTIIALNTSLSGPDVNGELASEGFNLFGNNSGAINSPAQTSDQIGTPASPVDPLLGPLQNNGGPTFTHAPLPGSPAIDQGESSGSPTDQRHFIRPVDFPEIADEDGGDGADIGALETAPAMLANISTRLRVETGDNAMIGGFIITGTDPRTAIVRALGPSLPVSGALADPIIEIYDSSGGILDANDNWRDGSDPTHVAETLPPANELESAIYRTFFPGAYTVVVRGTSDGTGIALFEVYDLDQTGADSKLGNISTRGFVDTGDNVMIGGVILVGSAPARALFRAIGPSLTDLGVPNALEDPTLELYDGNGGLIALNHDWRDDQEAEILATGIPPSHELESAIVRDFAPGGYTAIVRGSNNTVGVGLVEVYGLN